MSPLWLASPSRLSTVLPLLALFLPCTRLLAQEFRITHLTLDTQGAITLRHEADTNAYYVLWRGDSVTNMTEAVDIAPGVPGQGVLGDARPVAGRRAAFYRVRRVSWSEPLDADADGLDDVYELRRQPVLQPLRRSDAWGDWDQDGFSNWTEHRLGTEPQTANGAPVLAGSSHSLAIRTNGSLWGWGYNNAGQLANHATNYQTWPLPLGLDNNWAAIAGGGHRTAALKTNGALWVWGAPGYHSFEDVATGPETDPTQLGTDSDWLRIAAGRWHVLALKRDGSLWSWGWNAYGQLGDGTLQDQFVPVQIGRDHDWSAISAGTWHSLALKTDGTLWAWGEAGYGQLGIDPIVRVGADNDWGPPR